MKQVWKFELTQYENKINISSDHQILKAEVQNGVICMWVLVDTTKPTVERTILLIGTGQDVPDSNVSYIDTVLLHDDTLVLHVFEVNNNENN